MLHVITLRRVFQQDIRPQLVLVPLANPSKFEFLLTHRTFQAEHVTEYEKPAS